MANFCEKNGGGEEEVVVDDPNSLAKKIDAIRSTGPSKLQNDGPMWGVVKLVSQLCPSGD